MLGDGCGREMSRWSELVEERHSSGYDGGAVRGRMMGGTRRWDNCVGWAGGSRTLPPNGFRARRGERSGTREGLEAGAEQE